MPLISNGEASKGEAAMENAKMITSNIASLAKLYLPLLLSLLCKLPLQAQAFATSNQSAGSRVPAVLVFGDSIVDPGNNNVLNTVIRCDFPPYGKDFAGGVPTGRFCNGKIPTDFLASGLGVKDVLPPYLGAKLNPEDILTGVSFASSGSGYDPLTPLLVSVLSMHDQLALFREYKEKLRGIAGETRAARIVSESLYVVCAGSDDLANTYFISRLRSEYDMPSYVDFMVFKASSFIKELIEEGARKIAFVGLPPLGCLPSQRTLGGGFSRECVATPNEAALLYNSKIKMKIDVLLEELPKGSRIVFLDIYTILLDFIQQPNVYGFEESRMGCCGSGKLEVAVLCNSKTSTVCPDAGKFVFWDSYHPTEKAYKIIAQELLKTYVPYLY